MLCTISMVRYTINYENNKVKICVLLCIVFNTLLNKSNENCCRGVSHKPPFEDLISECDGEVVIVRYS